MIRLLILCYLIFNISFVLGNELSRDRQMTVEQNIAKPMLNLASVTTTISESHPVVRQKVSINYLITVPGYFNGSTQFELPSLSKAQLAKDSSFAVNGSAFIAGKKVATQLWQVNLYPEQSGLLELPALSFNVQYIDDKGNLQNRNLLSESLALFSYLPAPLKHLKKYIVSSDVSISEQWSGYMGSENSKAYQVGDIIQREITIIANDINSIEIPQILYKTFDGVQMSVHEAQLEDENDRGEQVATLKQKITYVVKQAGRYQLGGESLDWWDLDDGLQQSSFELHEIEVSGISPWHIKVFVIISIFVILLFILFFKIKKMPRSLTSQLKAAFKHKKWALFITLLYQKADLDSSLGRLKKGEQTEAASRLLSMYYQQPNKIVQTVNDSTLKELIK